MQARVRAGALQHSLRSREVGCVKDKDGIVEGSPVDAMCANKI